MTDLDDATRRLDEAEADYYRAEALAELAKLPGIRHAPLDAGATTHGVNVDGRFVGEIRPEWPGRQLGGWTAHTIDGVQLDGTFTTSRAAAAALAEQTRGWVGPPPD